YIFTFLLLLFILLFSIFYVVYRDKTSNALHAVNIKTEQTQNVITDNIAGQKPSLNKNPNKHKKEKLHKKITT
ncbi:MAG: hypothetical protein KKE35_01585, partial [Actinobacteria bacterium]|nr:hypothetical protein [Actinomycetota bacterium]